MSLITTTMIGKLVSEGKDREHMSDILSPRVCFFKQKTAYEITHSDWSSDVCSSEVGHAAVQGARAVVRDQVADTLTEQQLHDGGTGGSGSGHHHPYPRHLLAHHPQRVGQRGQHHDGGPVLVVVEDRDVQLVPQPRLDLEAPRRRDVLQVDPAV